MFKRLDAAVSVAAQLTEADVAAAVQAGFRSLVCHRPDGESPGQPDFDTIAAPARAAGMTVVYQPIVSGQLSDEDGLGFARHLEVLPHPVLAFCRSGTRSATLWALAQAGRQPTSAIIAQAGAAGYDLAPLAPRIEALAKRRG